VFSFGYAFEERISTRKEISGHETKIMRHTGMCVCMSTTVKAKNFARWKGEVFVLGFKCKFLVAL